MLFLSFILSRWGNLSLWVISGLFVQDIDVVRPWFEWSRLGSTPNVIMRR